MYAGRYFPLNLWAIWPEVVSRPSKKVPNTLGRFRYNNYEHVGRSDLSPTKMLVNKQQAMLDNL